MSLLFIFDYAGADTLLYFNVTARNTTTTGTVHPADRIGVVNNSFLNGTVYFNLTILGANTSTGMPANITNVNITFIRLNDNRQFAFQSNGTFMNVLGEGGHTLVNITSDLSTLPDGAYRINVSITNITMTVAYNDTASWNVTVDNIAPAINYSGGTPGNNTYALTTVAGLTINVTINETSPYNLTVTWANSTTVNSTVFIGYFCTSVSGGCINDAVPLRNFSMNLSLMENDNDELIRYNVTVQDQYGRSNTSITQNLVRDGVVPTGFSITSSQGSTMTKNVDTTMSCSVSETNPSTLVLKQDTTTICSSTGGTSCSATFTPTSAGDYAFTCTAQDQATNSNSATYTLSVTNGGSTSGSSSTSGGSSGGGGGSSSTVAIGTVTEGEVTSVDIDNNEVGVKGVTFTSNSELSNAKVTVVSQSEDQVSSKPDSSVGVFKYFQVQTQNFDDTDLQKAKITFVVDQAWLSQNHQTPDNVVLLRLESGAWKQYDAKLLHAENGVLTFESEVPGFSLFAIAVKGGTQTAPASEQTTTAPTAESTPEAASSPAPSHSRKTALIIGILLIVIAGVVLYFVMQKKK